ncbi:ABC transporter permease [Solimonas flava]|uniref:ABC transporter permease n=1 Tax=Solimonas flava TaxID=415849 RepID=UPI00042404E9|nr:ABC transporter permease [Solimonas flava]
MFRYYAWLAGRSLRKNPALTALMVIAIGLGIGASITTLTVLRVLSGDPIPQKSAVLFHPQIDPADLDDWHEGEEPPDLIGYVDGMNLLKAGKADRQVLLTGGNAVIQPEGSSLDPFRTEARFTTADFFPMFDVPMLYGRGWTAEDDERRARVAVITRSLNDKLYGGANSVGRTLRIRGNDFQIVGVVDHWRPTPHFYDLVTGNYAEVEDVFVPLDVGLDLKLGRNGTMNCWGNGGGADPEHSPDCVYMQLWVELGTPEKRAAYMTFLNNYVNEQRALGRFPRPNSVKLRSVMEWLDYQKVVPSDVRLQVWLALGFLVVCLVNTVGLMLAKFLRRSGEVAVRRAIGASRREVFAQFLVEAGAVGVAGAVLGLLLALLGLWAVRQQPGDYASLAHIDLPMLLATLALALLASLISGLLPAWRACQVAPALQLKSD